MPVCQHTGPADFRGLDVQGWFGGLRQERVGECLRPDAGADQGCSAFGV